MGQAMQQQYEQAQDKQSNKLAQSKGRDNRKWCRRRQGFVTEVPSLARSTSPFGEGEEYNAHTKPTWSTLFLLTLLPMQDAVIPLLGHLRVVTEPVQMATLRGVHRTRTNSRGYLRNRIGGSRSVPKNSTTMIELRNNKPLGANAPKRNKLRSANALKSTSSRVPM